MPFISFKDLGRHASMPLRFWNMYLEPTPGGPSANRRFPRPGLVQQYEVWLGPIRATILFLNKRVDVSGDEVYYDRVLIGNVPETGVVKFAVSNEECVLTVNRGAFYVTTTAVTVITDPDLPQVKDVFFIAGRFVYIHYGTDGEFSWSAVNDAQNIDGLAFVGTRTTEWWYPQDDITAPFVRSRGRKYDKGSTAIRSLCLVDNTMFFLGNDRIIYRAGAVPTRISDEDMENRIRQLTDAELATVSAYQAIWSGHTFYVVTLPRLGTWAFDVGQRSWGRWTTWDKPRFRVDVSDVDYYGDYYTGRLMKFDSNVRVDMEDSIERIVACYVPVTGGVQRNTNLVLHCTRGVGASSGYGSEPVVEMRYSDHEGADFTNWMEAPLGMVGDRSKAAMAHWVGLGSFQAPGRLFEFRCTDPVLFSPFQVAYNELRP
jgi:hypothetical protein